MWQCLIFWQFQLAETARQRIHLCRARSCQQNCLKTWQSLAAAAIGEKLGNGDETQDHLIETAIVQFYKASTTPRRRHSDYEVLSAYRRWGVVFSEKTIPFPYANFVFISNKSFKFQKFLSVISQSIDNRHPEICMTNICSTLGRWPCTGPWWCAPEVEWSLFPSPPIRVGALVLLIYLLSFIFQYSLDLNPLL